MAIKLLEGIRVAINAHAERAFPEECCGAMLGRILDDDTREVVKVVPVENTKEGPKERRYLIDPKALLQVEKQARQEKVDVVGIYHSHPNHPSQASDFDRDHAMPFWSYVIVSCLDGRADRMQSWRLRDDRSVMDEEELTAD